MPELPWICGGALLVLIGLGGFWVARVLNSPEKAMIVEIKLDTDPAQVRVIMEDSRDHSYHVYDGDSMHILIDVDTARSMKRGDKIQFVVDFAHPKYIDGVKGYNVAEPHYPVKSLARQQQP